MTTVKRNKAATKARILSTVQDILIKDGGHCLTIKRVEKDSGLTRTLIYRYFGSIEGLMQAYADSEAFFPKLDELLGVSLEEFNYLPLTLRYKRLRDGYWNALTKRPHVQAILAWSLTHSNPITRILEKKRSEIGVKAMQILLQGYDTEAFDYQALHTLLSSAFAYIGLRINAGLEHHGDIGLSGEEDLNRLNQTADFVIEAVELLIKQRAAEPI